MFPPEVQKAPQTNNRKAQNSADWQGYYNCKLQLCFWQALTKGGRRADRKKDNHTRYVTENTLWLLWLWEKYDVQQLVPLGSEKGSGEKIGLWARKRFVNLNPRHVEIAMSSKTV